MSPAPLLHFTAASDRDGFTDTYVPEVAGWPSSDETGGMVRSIRSAVSDGLSPQLRMIAIGDVGSAELRLASPLQVFLEEGPEAVVARSFDLDLFGDGETPDEALSVLKESIVEFYLFLRSEPNVSPRLRKQLEFLESIRRQ